MTMELNFFYYYYYHHYFYYYYYYYYYYHHYFIIIIIIIIIIFIIVIIIFIIIVLLLLLLSLSLSLLLLLLLEFIDQLTQHITEWNNASHAQHIALKAAIVLLATALQKPSTKSKAKDHQECLTKRLALWKEGEIESLLREGRAIQNRIRKTKRANPPDKAKIFAKLVMQGQINSALRFLSDDDYGGVLTLTDDVMRQLHEKHPEAQDAKLGSILFGPVEEVHDSLYQQINGEMIREAALRTKESGGPSSVDANGFKRILTCKSFKKSSAKPM